MDLKAGSRMRSVVDTTEVVVVRAPAGDVDLRCGGHPMAAAGTDGSPLGEIDPKFSGPTLLGKRYTDESAELEVLCTKAGDGVLSVGDTILAIKAAKPLPSSD
ncbi:MAG TPA: hypothetical protein VFV02_01395 [Acidimicrobiales bacterium]|nr:hypothetical protein [Acidimicrobiales bacterium]